MKSSTKIAFALAILMGFASFPAKAVEPGECTAWRPVLGGACKTRKCAVGVSPAIRLVPETVEFWKGREHRLHDRLRFTREGERWRLERLWP